MENKYISDIINNEYHQVNLDELITLIQNLKWAYFEKYHLEPKYIKIPMWLYTVLESHYKYTVAYNSNDNFSTYLGFIVCPTYSIDCINQIELF